MKKTILLLVMLCMATTAFCQEESKSTEARKEYFRFYYVLPGGVGNNVIAKANEGQLGLGVAITMYAHNNYHAILGFEGSRYNVTDTSLAGNAETTVFI